MSVLFVKWRRKLLNQLTETPMKIKIVTVKSSIRKMQQIMKTKEDSMVNKVEGGS